jgi:peptide/nickel transport system substrate-binding protein
MGMGGVAVGSGPMMVESFRANDHITLVPNPDYWGEQPEYETIRILQISEPSRVLRLGCAGV